MHLLSVIHLLLATISDWSTNLANDGVAIFVACRYVAPCPVSNMPFHHLPFVQQLSVLQPISEWLVKMTNDRRAKWRDVTISLTACQYIISIVQYCHLL